MRRQKPSPAFTLVELLVVMAVIGILVALLLPAVQSAREQARGITCRNNLRQMGLATHLFHDTFNHYPVARVYPRMDDPPELSCGGQQPSWFVHILPYLEQQAAFGKWDLFGHYEDHPDDVRATVISTYLCPSRRSADNAVIPPQSITILYGCGCGRLTITKHGGSVGDYAGCHGDFTGGSSGGNSDFWRGGNGTGMIVSSRARCDQAGRPTAWVDTVRQQDVLDGLSNTFLAGEMHVPR